MAGNDIASMLQNINLQKDLISQKTPEERQAEFLIGQGDALNNGSLGGAIAGGLIKGLGQVKMSKADRDKAEKLAAIEAQTKQAMEYQKWVQETEQKLKTYQMAEAERSMNQTGIDEALRLTVDYGDPQALSEIVKANPGMQGVLDDTLPDGVRFEGVNFDQQNGTLVPFGRDADGNVHYGQGQKWERFASPAFMEKRAASLYESQKQEAELAKTQAEADKAQVQADMLASGELPRDKAAGIEKTLRDDFQQQSKDFGVVADFYQRGQQGFKEGEAGNGSGDMKLVFSYMKVLDPTSVVREGEYANAATVGSVPDNLVRQYNAVLGGAKLGPQARRQIQSALESAFADKAKQQQANEKNYGALAERNRVDPQNVMIGVPTVKDISPTFGQGGAAQVSPQSIKAAFKAGQIDRATAEAQLKALGFE